MSISPESNVASPRSFIAGVPQSSISSMQDLLDSTAEEFILNKDFKTVFETCDTALKKITSIKVKDERSEEIKAGFCILGIQALAELDEWRYALPFVLQHYEHQEKLPATVMQMCMLLYIKVGEAEKVMDVASVWLHCSTNSNASEYGTIMELYLLYVLIPLGHLEEARGLIQGRIGICTLTEEQRQTALEVVERNRHRNDPQSPSNNCSPSLLTTKPRGAVLDKLGAILKYLHRKLLMSSSGTFHLQKIFLMAVLVYMLLTQMDPAHASSFMWISKVHQLLRHMWTALFAPYYQASKKIV